MRIIIYTLFFLSCVATIEAQVTIGSEIQPEKGLLLQLKDQKEDADNVTATTGGLILPRIDLKRTQYLGALCELSNSRWERRLANAIARISGVQYE